MEVHRITADDVVSGAHPPVLIDRGKRVCPQGRRSTQPAKRDPRYMHVLVGHEHHMGAFVKRAGTGGGEHYVACEIADRDLCVHPGWRAMRVLQRRRQFDAFTIG